MRDYRQTLSLTTNLTSSPGPLVTAMGKDAAVGAAPDAAESAGELIPARRPSVRWRFSGCCGCPVVHRSPMYDTTVVVGVRI